MAASDTCFKLLLLYLHLIAVFEKAGSPKYGPKICARLEACFDTLWGSTRTDGLDYEDERRPSWQMTPPTRTLEPRDILQFVMIATEMAAGFYCITRTP